MLLRGERRGSPLIAHQEYVDCLDLISQGFPIFEDQARALAEAYGFDLRSLEHALDDGYRRLFRAYVGLIRDGRVDFVPIATSLARRRGYDLQELVGRS